jgi:hypothetical protein
MVHDEEQQLELIANYSASRSASNSAGCTSIGHLIAGIGANACLHNRSSPPAAR